MIKVNREALIPALERASRIVNPRSTMPILTHVLVEVSDGMRYRTTNARAEVSGKLDASGSGAFTVDVKALLGAAQALSGDDIKIKPGSGFVELSGSGKRSFKLPTLDAADFPAPMATGGEKSTIAGAALTSLIEPVAWSARTDNDKPEQCCIRIAPHAGKLRAMATKGHVLALKVVESDSQLDIMLPIELARLVTGHDGEVAVTWDQSAMAFDFGDHRVASLAPAGQFPAVEHYLDIIKPTIWSTVESADMLASVKAIRRVDSDGDLLLKFSEGLLALECTGDGSSRDEIEVDGGAPIEAWFDANYIVDALNQAPGKVRVGLGPQSNTDPIVFESDGWKAIVMPRQPAQVKARKAK